MNVIRDVTMNDEFIIRSKTKIKTPADGVIKRWFTGLLKINFGNMALKMSTVFRCYIRRVIKYLSIKRSVYLIRFFKREIYSFLSE